VSARRGGLLACLAFGASATVFAADVTSQAAAAARAPAAAARRAQSASAAQRALP
jgi:hypothetical protein